MIIPNKWKNIKCSKPPTSVGSIMLYPMKCLHKMKPAPPIFLQFLQKTYHILDTYIPIKSPTLLVFKRKPPIINNQT